jgi:hypothetical protein
MQTPNQARAINMNPGRGCMPAMPEKAHCSRDVHASAGATGRHVTCAHLPCWPCPAGRQRPAGRPSCPARQPAAAPAGPAGRPAPAALASRFAALWGWSGRPGWTRHRRSAGRPAAPAAPAAPVPSTSPPCLAASGPRACPLHTRGNRQGWGMCEPRKARWSCLASAKHPGPATSGLPYLQLHYPVLPAQGPTTDTNQPRTRARKRAKCRPSRAESKQAACRWGGRQAGRQWGHCCADSPLTCSSELSCCSPGAPPSCPPSPCTAGPALLSELWPLTPYSGARASAGQVWVCGGKQHRGDRWLWLAEGWHLKPLLWAQREGGAGSGALL